MLTAAWRTGAPDRWRRRCLAAGIVTLAVTFLPPLEDLSRDLASAHMVQHVLLLLVAAPLLALSVPPRIVPLRRLPPVGVWLIHAGTVWFWHAAGPYDAAVESNLIHVAEHGSFLVTAVLFWSVVIGAPGAAVSRGFGVLLVFAMAMQSVFLSVLLTFARTPWYSVYASTTQAWDLDPLVDQQLAGVIMWIPAGLVYLGAGLALAVAWLREADQEEVAV